MKIEYGNWTLSLFETEYKDISIEENYIKVINPEGKKKTITFQSPEKQKNANQKTKSAGINSQEGSSPKAGKNLTLRDDNSKPHLLSTQNAEEITKLRKLLEDLDFRNEGENSSDSGSYNFYKEYRNS